MSRLSFYVATNNAIITETTLFQTIESILNCEPFELILCYGGPYGQFYEGDVIDDGTYERLIDLIHTPYSKTTIKLITNPWLHKLGHAMTAIQKSIAMGNCSGDYCILSDNDEVLHEDSYDELHHLPEKFPEAIAFNFSTLHFYRDYSHINLNPSWYTKKPYMIKNNMGAFHGIRVHKSGFTSNDIITFEGEDIGRYAISTGVMMYHYGWVRSKKVLQQKQNGIERSYNPNWKDVGFEWDERYLDEFEGIHPKVMKNKINKFNYGKYLNI